MSGLGDALRSLANQYSSGVFGQGNAKQLPGETDKQYLNRIVAALGASAVTFNNSVKKSKVEKLIESFKAGAIGQTILGIAPWAAAGLAVVLIVPKLRNRSKSKSKTRKY